MRYIQSLVTRTRQTDKIPMNLMLDAINHTLAAAYDIEFESLLPTYLCDCNYKDFKTSSFHKRFNPCHNCLMIDLRKTVSRTFRYTNKDDVRVKDPITETETVFLFFADEGLRVDINSKDKIERGFVGEDLDGRALPKELIAEFKKDDDWGDFFTDDSSWDDYQYQGNEDGEYDWSNGQSWEDYEMDSSANHTNSDEEENPANEVSDSNSEYSSDEVSPASPIESQEYDFQILQQIKSKKYILDVDQKLMITNVATIDLDKLPTKEECGDDSKWMRLLLSFIRAGWCRINILRNSGDGDKELGMIANQLRLMSEAYQQIFALENQIYEAVADSSKGDLEESIDNTSDLEKELMPVIKKMVTLGREKEAILIAKNWLPILKELIPLEVEEGEEADKSGDNQIEKRHMLIADVLAVLGILELRRHQDGWAAQHLCESIRLAYQYTSADGENLYLYKYLSDPRIKTSSTTWLLKEDEGLRLSELLAEKASEYLDKRLQWYILDSVLSYLKRNQSNFDQKELKKSVPLMTSLTKRMLKRSWKLIDEDRDFFVPKVVRLQYDMAYYYSSKGKWEETKEYIGDARSLILKYEDFVPLNLQADVLALSVKSTIENGEDLDDIDNLIEDLVKTCLALHQQNPDFESVEKLVNAFLERIENDIERLISILPSTSGGDEVEDGEDSEDRDEEDEDLINGKKPILIDIDEEDARLFREAKQGNLFGDIEEPNLFSDIEESKPNEEDEEYEEIEDWEQEDEDEYDVRQIEEYRKEIDQDNYKAQSLIDDYRKNYLKGLEGEEDSGTLAQERKLQILEVRLDLLKTRYLTLVNDQEDKLRAFDIYQSLIERISQLLNLQYDKKLFQLYRREVRQSALLGFKLQKYNEVKKGYKQLIAYQKSRIANMPQKGREYQYANLQLAQTYCYLSAFYLDLETYDHALKYAQIAQSLADKYADTSTDEDVEFKMSVYSLIHLIAKDGRWPEIDKKAEKEYNKLERIFKTKF